MRISQWPKSAGARWYLGVLCSKCRKPILFALDRTEGKGPLDPIEKLVLTCPEPQCSHQGNYSQARISSFQKAGTA